MPFLFMSAIVRKVYMQNFTGKQYLKIDIASLFGLDKKTWEERLTWFEQNKDNLESLSDKADSPNCYIAAVNAYRDVEAGKPIGYAINLDATASGCQILSLLMGDVKSATRVNLVDTGKREDLYTYIYNKMLEKAPSTSHNITRDSVKKAIMTSLYGSQKKPKEVFGENNYWLFEDVMNEELPEVWALNKFLLKRWDPTKEVYSWVMPDNFHVDCHVVNTRYYEAKLMNYDITFSKKVVEPCKEGKFLSANLAHSVDGLINREITMRCSFSNEYKAELKKLINLNAISLDYSRNYHNHPKDNSIVNPKFKTLWKRYEESGFLSARILQYVDGNALAYVGNAGKQAISELIDSLPEHSFEVYAVHDCFRVLPNYGDDVRQQYRVICSQIAKSNMLQNILQSMFETDKITVTKSNELAELVLKSEYAIC